MIYRVGDWFYDNGHIQDDYIGDIGFIIRIDKNSDNPFVIKWMTISGVYDTGDGEISYNSKDMRQYRKLTKQEAMLEML